MKIKSAFCILTAEPAKRLNPMKLLDTLCRRLGVSHQQMAALIGSKKASVTKSINGIRTLGYEPTMALVQLQQALDALPAENPWNRRMDAPEKERWEWLLEGQKIGLEVLQKRIRRLAEKQRACCALLQLLDGLLEDQKTDPARLPYLRSLKETIESKLRSCSPAVVKRLQIRAELLRQEITLMEEALYFFDSNNTAPL